MEIRQLEYFMAVSKELHFTRAAEKLNIAQPTLSQQIKSLEGQVSIPLFDRIGKQTVLTEAGKILLKHSQRIFFELEQAKAALEDLNGLQRGKLAIGTLFSCSVYLLPKAILPKIELSVVGLRSGDIVHQLLENDLDIGITFLPIEDAEFESIPLFTEELSLAVPKDHPFAYLNEVNFEQLAHIDTVLLPNNYYLRQIIDGHGEELGMTLKPVMELTTLGSLTQMVREGMGATILPAPYLDFLNDRDIVKVNLVNPTPMRQVGIIYRKNKFMCTTTKTFIEQIMHTSKTLNLDAKIEEHMEQVGTSPTFEGTNH